MPRRGDQNPQSPTIAPSGAFLAAIILIGAFSFLGCNASPITRSSVVTFLIETMPTNLDPRVGTDAQSQRLDGLMFNSLVERDANMNVKGDLAERWEMPDPLTYVFHLRSGVKFQDGRPLSSADVKFTFDSILSGAIQSPKRGSFRMVKSVEAPDPLTVKFHLSEPYASFPWALVRPAIGIVPAGSGADFSQHPVGTGPFQFVSMSQDDQILLQRNPNYFAGAPTVSDVRFRIVPEAVVRALELRKGSADLEFNSLTPDMVRVLAKTQDLEVAEQPGTSLAYLAFNCQDSILSRREVRQALAYATDREEMVRTLLRGEARVADGLLPPGNWAYEPDTQKYNYDPGRAEQLLDQVGFPRHGNPKTGMRLQLTIKTSTDQSVRLIAEVLQDEWKRVGIDLQILPLEFATLYADITRGSFQIYTLRWVGANNDPDIFEYVFSSKKIPPNGANRGRYRNPELDSLVDQGRVEIDQNKRKAIFSQVQKIVATDEPYLPLWFLDNISVHRDSVHHIVFTATGDYDFLDDVSYH
jgi:peptide/nickel transport system substrate-binding protein